MNNETPGEKPDDYQVALVEKAFAALGDKADPEDKVSNVMEKDSTTPLTDTDIVENSAFANKVYLDDMGVVCSTLLQLTTAMNSYTMQKSVTSDGDWQGEMAKRYMNVAHNASQGAKFLQGVHDLSKKKHALFISRGEPNTSPEEE